MMKQELLDLVKVTNGVPENQAELQVEKATNTM